MSLELMLEQIVRRVLREELAAIAPKAGLVTVAAFAAARSISTSTVREAIRDGRLKATRIGRAVRVEASAEISEPRSTGSETVAIKVARKLGLAVVK